MANRDVPQGFYLVRTVIGEGARLEKGYVASNQVIAPGDALFATVGYLQTGETTDKAIVGFAQGTQATSVGTRGSMLFVPAAEGYVFEGQCSGTPTQAVIYTLVDIEGSAGGSSTLGGRSVQEINENATSNKNIYLIYHNAEKTSMGLNAKLQFVVARSKFSARGPVASGSLEIG